MPDLSIIIVSFNARADLERCLESLHAAPPSIAHEIVVVDNQSTDGSAQAARRWADVTVIESGANLGFARANNLGDSGQRRRAHPSAEQRHRRAGRRDRSSGRRTACAARRRDRRTPAGRRTVAVPSCRSGPMLGPFSELRQKVLFRGQVKGLPILARVCRTDTTTATRARVGHRRLSAGAASRRRSGRPARRALLHVYGGRRLLRGDPGARPLDSVHARGRNRAPAGALGRRPRRRRHGARIDRSQLAFYEKHHPAWAPLLRLFRQSAGNCSGL